MTPNYHPDDDYRWDDLSLRITGRTLDDSGNPLVGCTVKLYQTTGHALIATTTSTAHGDFEFSGLSEDREGTGIFEDYRWDDYAGSPIHHYIIAEHEGYTTVQSAGTLVAGDHVDLTLTAVVVPVVLPAAVPAGGPYPEELVLRQIFQREEAERRRAEQDFQLLLAIVLSFVREEEQQWVA